MENNHLLKKPELSHSRPGPFVSSAKLVIGVGVSVLGLIGKAIKGAVGLLVNRRDETTNTPQLPTYTPDSTNNKQIQDKSIPN